MYQTALCPCARWAEKEPSYLLILPFRHFFDERHFEDFAKDYGEGCFLFRGHRRLHDEQRMHKAGAHLYSSPGTSAGSTCSACTGPKATCHRCSRMTGRWGTMQAPRRATHAQGRRAPVTRLQWLTGAGCGGGLTGVDIVWELPAERTPACMLQQQLSRDAPHAVNAGTHK